MTRFLTDLRRSSDMAGTDTPWKAALTAQTASLIRMKEFFSSANIKDKKPVKVAAAAASNEIKQQGGNERWTNYATRPR